MTQQVLDPDRTPTPTPRRRPPFKLIAAVAAVAIAVPVGIGVANGIGGLTSSFEQQTIDRSHAPLMLALRDLSDYRAASGTFQVVVDLERDTPWVPSLISGERTTLLAVGNVDAVVDIGDLGPDRVVPSADGRSVAISLPAPRLDPAAVDPVQSRVIDRDRGLTERIAGAVGDDPVDDSELFRLATQRLDEAAVQSDLLARAETGTRDMLTTLAGSLGYEQVTVTFDAPLPAAD